METNSGFNENYKTGLKYEFGFGVKKDYKTALEYYKKGKAEGDKQSAYKVKNSTISKESLIFNGSIFIISMILGIIYNYIWIALFVTGLSLSVFAILKMGKYWILNGHAVIINLSAFIIGSMIFIPLGAVIPYLNGVDYFAITLLAAVAFFVFAAGIILYISNRTKLNLFVIIGGVYLIAIAAFTFTARTQEMLYDFEIVNNEVEITKYHGPAAEIVIPSILNNRPVTKIRGSAFMGHEATKITVGSHIKSIGNYAFAEMPNLTTIILPDGITIGSGLFYNSSKLVEITMPSDLEVIPSYTFYGLREIDEIDIPDGVYAIGAHAFNGVKNVTGYDLPAALIFIGEYAFANNDALVELIIPETVTGLGAYMLYNSKSIETIELPAHITTIPTGFLMYNQNLTHYEVPEQITTISDFAFHGTNLETIGLHDNITSIGVGAFANSKVLTTITIPTLISTISEELFANNESLESVYLPEGIVSIGNRAFMNNKALTTIELPNSITTIGTGAFENATSLTELELPVSLTSIGARAFAKAEKIETLTIPDGVKRIPEYAFYQMTSLTSIHFADDITEIGAYSFYQSSLSSITIPGTVDLIGNYAFFQNDLVDLILEEGVERIGYYTFYDNKDLETVQLPESLIRIDDIAFGLCAKIEEVYISDSVNFVGHFAFYGCISLTIKLETNQIPSTWVESWNPNNRPIEYNQ